MFESLSTNQLIRRIETAPDFGYDDEEVELSRRLAQKNKAWKWGKFCPGCNGQRIEVYGGSNGA